MSQIGAEIARLRKEEADERKKFSDAQGKGAKAAADARTRRDRASRTSSTSLAASHLREAARLERVAAEHEKKAAVSSKRLSDIASKLAAKSKALEGAEREAQRRRDRDEKARQQRERRHAQELSRLGSPSVRHVLHEVRIVEPPKPEKLRVLYLAANPELDLRVDVEVRGVRDAVQKALHRDLVEIDHRPAATPEDLLDGINEMRPHVIHFAGHGGQGLVLFDDAEVGSTSRDVPRGRPISFALLARAVAATDQAPTLLVLNACDTLAGAEVLLNGIPAVIAMATSVGDLAAGVFAARFYSAIASAQSVAAALDQSRVAIEAAGLSQGWEAATLTREGINLRNLILVRPPGG
jgi:CHAT domain